MDHSTRSTRTAWIIFFAALGVILFLITFAADRAEARRPAIVRLLITAATNQPPAGLTNSFSSQTKTNALSIAFIESQFALILSDAVLTPVLLDLRNTVDFISHIKVSPETPLANGLKKLRSLITLRETGNTGLIEIRVYSPHPAVSAAIANKIADVYLRHAATNAVKGRLLERASGVLEN